MREQVVEAVEPGALFIDQDGRKHSLDHIIGQVRNQFVGVEAGNVDAPRFESRA